MFFVIPPPPLPSRQARDLGARVTELIRLMRHLHPELCARDVRKALRIAERNVRCELRDARPRRALRMLAGLGSTLGLGIAVLALRSDGARAGSMLVLFLTVLGALALGLAGVFLWRRRGRTPREGGRSLPAAPSKSAPGS